MSFNKQREKTPRPVIYSVGKVGVQPKWYLDFNLFGFFLQLDDNKQIDIYCTSGRPDTTQPDYVLKPHREHDITEYTEMPLFQDSENSFNASVWCTGDIGWTGYTFSFNNAVRRNSMYCGLEYRQNHHIMNDLPDTVTLKYRDNHGFEAMSRLATILKNGIGYGGR